MYMTPHSIIWYLLSTVWYDEQSYLRILRHFFILDALCNVIVLIDSAMTLKCSHVSRSCSWKLIKLLIKNLVAAKWVTQNNLAWFFHYYCSKSFLVAFKLYVHSALFDIDLCFLLSLYWLSSINVFSCWVCRYQLLLMWLSIDKVGFRHSSMAITWDRSNCIAAINVPGHDVKLHPHLVKLCRIGCVGSGLVLAKALM